MRKHFLPQFNDKWDHRPAVVGDKLTKLCLEVHWQNQSTLEYCKVVSWPVIPVLEVANVLTFLACSSVAYRDTQKNDSRSCMDVGESPWRVPIAIKTLVPVFPGAPDVFSRLISTARSRSIRKPPISSSLRRFCSQLKYRDEVYQPGEETRALPSLATHMDKPIG